jgi:galactokinase
MQQITDPLRRIFIERFSSDPHIYFSPGRINLIGEHVDYNDGFVMPAAIDKGVYYAIRENGSDSINFYSVDFDEAYSTTMSAVAKKDGWKNYVLSVVNQFLKLDRPIGGFDCVFSGDIPRGSGMSSSAAVEGGLAYALNEIFHTGLDRKKLALLCQRAEHDFPNVKCGIMDQFANMFGKKDQVILLDCRSKEHQYFPLNLNGYELVLVNSKVHHSLASSEYNVRRQQCEQGLAIIKTTNPVNSFRELSPQQMEGFKSFMPAPVFDCCSYVVEEIERTQQAAAYLRQEDMINFGQLMNATHWGLSKKYKVSCTELDFLVSFAQGYEGVIGSRLMGGGFGGCTINLVRHDVSAAFAEAITAAYKKEFNIDPEVYFVQSGDGTRKIEQGA